MEKLLIIICCYYSLSIYKDSKSPLDLYLQSFNYLLLDSSDAFFLYYIVVMCLCYVRLSTIYIGLEQTLILSCLPWKSKVSYICNFCQDEWITEFSHPIKATSHISLETQSEGIPGYKSLDFS